MSIKGVSPLVATVLLIGFTIAIATAVSVWLIPFISRTTTHISEETDIQLICSRGGVSLSNLKYNSTTSSLSGRIENTGSINLGNISLQIIYTDFTVQYNDLCLSGGAVVICSSSNLTIVPREIIPFNLPASSNYDLITLTTNCSRYGVYDRVLRNEVT